MSIYKSNVLLTNSDLRICAVVSKNDRITLMRNKVSLLPISVTIYEIRLILFFLLLAKLSSGQINDYNLVVKGDSLFASKKYRIESNFSG